MQTMKGYDTIRG